LAHLNGELPPGLPQDVVDAIAGSLVSHSALNATTLRIFKKCELNTLSLAGCRGVSDEWLEALVASASAGTGHHRRRPSSPFSPPALPDLSPAGTADTDDGAEARRRRLTFDRSSSSSSSSSHDDEDMSACSTASFVSAASHHHKFEEGEDQTMVDAAMSPPPTPHRHTSILSMGDGVPGGHGCASSVTSALTLLDLRGSADLTDRGLLRLRDLAQLEVAKLDSCHGLAGYGLLALASSHRLRALSLANCRRLTDEAVISVSHLSGIRAIALDGCRCLTDRSMTALADLKELRKLGLSQCDLITDRGLEPLASLDQLEELSLGWCRLVTDRGIELLTVQPGRASNLTILRLARIPITDTGVEHLARLVALEELDLSGCSGVGSAALAKTLHRLVGLKNLDVSYCPGILYVYARG
jgi:hypothetical protein